MYQIEVKITTRDMYDFLMSHTYRGFSGIFGTAVGIAVLIYCAVSYGRVEAVYSIMYGVFGVLFLFYTPVSLYMRAKRQILLTPMFQKPIVYHIKEESITLEQEEERADISWDSITKVIQTKRSVILYLSKVRAFILPKEALGEQYDGVLQCIKKHAPEGTVKIKVS